MSVLKTILRGDGCVAGFALLRTVGIFLGGEARPLTGP